MSTPMLQDIANLQADPAFANVHASPAQLASLAPQPMPALGAPVQAPGPTGFGPPPLPAPTPGRPAPVPGPAQPLPSPLPVTPVPGAPVPAQVPVPGSGSRPASARPGSAPVTDPLAGIEQDQVRANEKLQEAAGKKVDAIQEGITEEDKARQGLVDLRQAQADELKVKQDQIAQWNKELDADDDRNLEVAKNKTIPGFWASGAGNLVGSILAVALTGAGAALLGQTRNTALEALQHNIDRYMMAEKDKIDNLYKFAERKGRLNDQIRKQYQIQLLDLKDQHTYILEAARDRIAQVQAHSKGAVDVAAAEYTKNELDKQIIADRIGVRKLRMEMKDHESQAQLRKAQASAAYANAAESRAGAKLKLQQAENERLGLGKSGKVGDEALKAQGFADTAEANHQMLLKLAPMSQKGLKTVIEDMQREELLDANKGLKGVVMWTGLYKTLEEKLSPADKQAFLAMRQFINADLRRESGAAIGANEFKSAQARYFDALGDTPEIRQQKATNRQQSIHSMRVAGRQEQGGNPVTGLGAGQSQRPAMMIGPDKKVYRLQPDGNYLPAS